MTEHEISKEIELDKGGIFNRWRALVILSVIALVGLVATALSVTFLGSVQQERMEETLKQQMDILALARSEQISSWITSRKAADRRFAETTVVRIIASDYLLRSTDERDEFTRQLSGFQGQFNRFSENSGADDVYLLTPDGKLYLSSRGGGFVDEAARDWAIRQVEGGAWLERDKGGLALYLVTPVMIFQGGEAGSRVAAILVSRHNAGSALSGMIAPVEGSAATFHLTVNYLQRGEAGQFSAGAGDLGSTPDSPGEGALYKIRSDNASYYGLNRGISACPCVVRVSVAESAVTDPLGVYRFSVALIGILLVLVVCTLIAAFWNHNRHAAQRLVADDLRRSAERTATQRRFLEGINSAVSDWIAVKGMDGHYIYANSAMLQSLGMVRQQLVGASDDQVMSPEMSARTRLVCDRAIASGQPARDSDVVASPDGNSWYLMSAVPLPGEDGAVDGLIILAKDVTEHHQMQVEREAVAANTVRALVTVIEHRDPFLKGQTELTLKLAGGVFDILGVEADKRHFLAQAAQLSQVGKSLIPEQLSSRTDRLSSEERRDVQNSICVALELIEPLGMPGEVFEALSQMYERLDGSGFPKGISGEELCTLGQILSLADTLVSRSLPRSYRQSISIEETLKVYKDHPGKYQSSLVAALEEFLSSSEGEAFISCLEQSSD
ncbi:MAG: HD domain-containing phosphohydrolase [Candidatus Sedimenticola sp. 20ELBAFRAG]